MTVVILETIYFQRTVTDAKPVIEHLAQFFKGIFPAATCLEARFNGVKDRHVGAEERFSKGLWKNAKIGKRVACSDTFTMMLPSNKNSVPSKV
jgi:hypothetical protein